MNGLISSRTHELMEVRDGKRLHALQKQLTSVKLLIVDELGYVPFTAIGEEFLFKIFSRRYEHGTTLLISNLPFDEWTSVLGSEWLTGALLERPTHHAHILEMNGELYKLATSKKRQQRHAKPNISFESGGARAACSTSSSLWLCYYLCMVFLGKRMPYIYLNHDPVANAAANTNKNGGAKFGVGSGNINTSRIRFKGVENLGGSLKALFLLRAGFDSSTSASNESGAFNHK